MATPVAPDDKLKEAFARHKNWIVSGKPVSDPKNERGHFENADFRHLNLSFQQLDGAQFQGGQLDDAHLQNASLVDANFGNARLVRAKLGHATLDNAYIGAADLSAADVEGASLRGAKFPGAILLGMTGLLAEQLGGTNLAGAKLPEEIAKFSGLERVAEISKNAKTTFIAMLAACVYSWLAVGTTTDVALVLNSTASPLPIINASLPIAGFYWVAPVILVIAYIYLHLYLQRLWEGLTILPAVFPDGTPLDRMAYAWLLNGLVRAHFARLKADQSVFTRIENFVSIVLAWLVVPGTLVAFWLRYIPRHDYYGTALHVVLMSVATFFGFKFYRQAKTTLRVGLSPREDDAGSNVEMSNWELFRQWLRTFRLDWRTAGLAGAWTAGLAGAGALISIGAFTDTPYRPTASLTDARTDWYGISDLFAALGLRTYSDLREAELSTKPKLWSGSEIKEVQGARLPGENLEYADASSAFIVRADLRRANAHRASLIEANLEGADLWQADFSESDLSEAILRNVNLSGANFHNANFDDAYLERAAVTLHERLAPDVTNFEGASLVRAKLKDAILVGATLSGARLYSTDFEGANLQGAKLIGVQNCMQVIAGGLPMFTTASGGGTSFKKAILKEANLKEAVLVDVDFEGADFSGAMLKDAKLNGSNLSKVINLQQDQLAQACGDAATKVPDGMTIRECEAPPC